MWASLGNLSLHGRSVVQVDLWYLSTSCLESVMFSAIAEHAYYATVAAKQMGPLTSPASLPQRAKLSLYLCILVTLVENTCVSPLCVSLQLLEARVVVLP